MLVGYHWSMLLSLLLLLSCILRLLLLLWSTWLHSFTVISPDHVEQLLPRIVWIHMSYCPASHSVEVGDDSDILKRTGQCVKKVFDRRKAGYNLINIVPDPKDSSPKDPISHFVWNLKVFFISENFRLLPFWVYMNCTGGAALSLASP